MITDLRKSQEIACKLHYKQSDTAVKYDRSDLSAYSGL